MKELFNRFYEASYSIIAGFIYGMGIYGIILVIQGLING
jgi:hypothetical protein